MTLKVKFRTQFPASVLVQSPLLLDKTGAVYTFSIDNDALQSTFSNLFQPVDDTLSALAALNSTAGLLVQTGVDAFTKRTLTGTANEITVTNGDGASGAPTLSLPAALTYTGKTVTGGMFTGGLWNKITITAPATAATLTLIDGTTLTGPAASGTVMTLGNVETVTGAKTFNDAKLLLAGSSSGATTVKAAATASGSITIPSATDTLVGKATTDTLTNKTIDTAGTGNHIQISGVDITRGQILGTGTNDSASAGNIGEYISSSVARASPVSLTTATPANLTSISLTAGDWDVTCNGAFTGTATAASVLHISLSTTTATEATTTPGASAAIAGGNIGATDIQLLASLRFSLSSTTTIFAVMRADFGSGTVSAWGLLSARRRR